MMMMIMMMMPEKIVKIDDVYLMMMRNLMWASRRSSSRSVYSVPSWELTYSFFTPRHVWLSMIFPFPKVEYVVSGGYILHCILLSAQFFRHT